MPSCVMILILSRRALVIYGTAQVQVYKLTHRASRNFASNSHVGLVRHEEYTAHEQLLIILASNSSRAVYSRVITYKW